MIYKEILDALQNCYFGEFNENDWTMDNLVGDFFNKRMWDSGATKLVLYPNDKELNLVVKIPFIGYYTSDPYFDADTGEYVYENEEYFQEFSGAGYSDDAWDYCEAELNIYTDAQKEGLEHLFLKTECIGLVNSHPIYVQERVSCFEDVAVMSSYSLERKGNTKEICSKNGIYCFHTSWLCDFLDFYGEDELVKLDKFLFDHQITDLHSGNLGYLADGTPIIIDYAGFEY